jgi:uncharacterized 2Fe-2S/4Fe-4S cluster protein (DUF4445 family)
MSAATKTFALAFPQLGRTIAGRGEETVFQAARRSGVRVVGACGGRGTCGSCMVLVSEGETHRLAPEDERGLKHARDKKWARACQMQPRSDCTIEVAERSVAPVARTEVDAAGAEILPVRAAVTGIDAKVAEATLSDTASDFSRVTEGCGLGGATADLAALRQLPALLRQHDWTVRTLVRGREVIGFAAPKSRLLGMAVDFGTTNAAAFLIDLETGARLASLGIENPQTAWGADLISRINYAIQVQGGAAELQASGLAALNALAHDLCHAIGAQPTDIVDVAICGNTAMHHLLLGLPVRQLGRAPFVAAMRGAMDIKARDLGFEIAPGAYVHLAPNVGGFVGGDHVTALLATRERWSAAGASIVMDIGTNTEISLIHGGRILSASCPSGPALEGGHISCGMRAADGAIEHVRALDGRLKVETIGRKTAVGVCGSGVLDTIAALRELALLNDGGRLEGDHPDLGEADGKRAAVLAPGVSFSQADIRAVQLAKAAIRTGTDLLLAEAGIAEAGIGRFIIAGAFGAYIAVESGIAIGLFPDLPRERFEQVGNAAGAGIRGMLASVEARHEAAALAHACEYIELSSRTGFQKTFLHRIGFNSGPRRTAP